MLVYIAAAVLLAGCLKPHPFAGQCDNLGEGCATSDALVDLQDARPPLFSPWAYVKSTSTNGGDTFGDSMALSEDGRTLAVSAYGDDADGENVGAVFIYVHDGTGWAFQEEVRPAGPSALFGFAVALSGDGQFLAVGASTTPPANTGGVYTFTRVGGTFMQDQPVGAPLLHASPSDGDRFGYALALSDDGLTLAVSTGDDSDTTGINPVLNEVGTDSGAVYVFTRPSTASGAWSHQALIKASNAGAGDSFGWGVALSANGNRLAVGAHNEDSASSGVGGAENSESCGGCGAVYVFKRSGMTWSQEAYIKAGAPGPSDQFGFSIALSDAGDILAIGAPGEASGVNGNQNDESSPGAGAVYVLSFAVGWQHAAYVKASNPGGADNFGWEIALSADGTRLIAGAPREDGSAREVDGLSDELAMDAGAAYVFASSGGWVQQAYVKAANADAMDRLGQGLAISGDGSVFAVGAPTEDSEGMGINGDATSNTEMDSGAAYVFH